MAAILTSISRRLFSLFLKIFDSQMLIFVTFIAFFCDFSSTNIFSNAVLEFLIADLYPIIACYELFHRLFYNKKVTVILFLRHDNIIPVSEFPRTLLEMRG